MNKRDFNVVGNEGTDNQELAKGIAFVKSRRAEPNVVQMVESMRDQAIPNGVIINDAYCDRSMTRDYDREALNAFFATLKEEDFEVVVVRSLNEITDDIYDLEEFVKTITDMGIWLYLKSAPIGQAVMKNTVPAMIAMLMVLIYNLADTFFIGQTKDAFMVASVSLVTPAFLLFMVLGTVLGIGGTSVISRAMGAATSALIINMSR